MMSLRTSIAGSGVPERWQARQVVVARHGDVPQAQPAVLADRAQAVHDVAAAAQPRASERVRRIAAGCRRRGAAGVALVRSAGARTEILLGFQRQEGFGPALAAASWRQSCLLKGLPRALKLPVVASQSYMVSSTMPHAQQGAGVTAFSFLPRARAGQGPAPAVERNCGNEGAEALAPGHYAALAQAEHRHQVILAARRHIATIAAPCAARQAAVVALRSAC